MTRLPRLGAVQSARRREARGFTLLEILVALALGVVILLALTILFSRNTGNQSELERTIRQLESARFSLDTLAEDVMHAGFFSDFNPDNLQVAPAYQTPNPCAVAPENQGWDTGVTPIQMPVPIEGIAAAGAVACLANRRAGTEAIVVRRADTGATIPIAAGTNNNLYIQISRCRPGIEAQRLVAAAVPNADPEDTFSLRRCDSDGETVLGPNDAIRRLMQRTYFVASCNDCAAGDGIPTLKRVEMIDGALRTTSIAEGVENLQVEYGLDTDGDGQPDNFVTVGGVDGAGGNVWENVVSVRLHLLTRNTQATPGYADVRTYQLGPDVSVAAPADGFKRTLMTTTVRLYNVGGRRE
jgi:type IV pilus assembly protein PilW